MTTDTIYDLNPESNLLRHAHAEMQRAGYSHQDLLDFDTLEDLTDRKMDAMMYRETMKLIHTFAQASHSGFSAWASLSLFNKLVHFEALTPLTEDFTEWQEVCNGMWQSRRNSEAFSIDGGQTYYLLSEERRWMRRLLWLIPALKRKLTQKQRVRLLYTTHISKRLEA